MWEVIRLRGGHEGGILITRLMPLLRRDTREVSLPHSPDRLVDVPKFFLVIQKTKYVDSENGDNTKFGSPPNSPVLDYLQ